MAWGTSEVVDQLLPKPLEEMQHLMREEDQIIEMARRGDITADAAKAAIERLDDEHKSNPYVRIYANKSLMDAEKRSRVEEQRSKDTITIFLQQLIWFLPLAFHSHSSLQLAIKSLVAIGGD